MAASAGSMRERCSTTTPPASRRRWLEQSPAPARPTRITARDSQGRYLDGGKTYKVTLPAPIPAARFWSFNVYDNQTRSLLETDQKLAGIDSTLSRALKKNADGSVTVWFGPKAPAGQEGNWVQTMARQGLERHLAALWRRCSRGSTRAGSRAISSW